METWNILTVCKNRSACKLSQFLSVLANSTYWGLSLCDIMALIACTILVPDICKQSVMTKTKTKRTVLV